MQLMTITSQHCIIVSLTYILTISVVIPGLQFYGDDKNYVRNTNFFQWLDVFINLMILGSNVKAVDLHGRSVLHLAAKNGLADAVNVLMQEKSQLDVLISLVRHHWQQLSRTSQWDQSNGCLRLEIP